MQGTLTFLGTGTSMGVPTLACECPVCTSLDPHDRRLRPSVMLRWTEPSTGSERVVVIDTGPDFREQALRERLTHVDAVFYTHAHADHILGMDDLRPLKLLLLRERAARFRFMPIEKRQRPWSGHLPTLSAASDLSESGARGASPACRAQHIFRRGIRAHSAAAWRSHPSPDSALATQPT